MRKPGSHLMLSANAKADYQRRIRDVYSKFVQAPARPDAVTASEHLKMMTSVDADARVTFDRTASPSLSSDLHGIVNAFCN